MDNKDMHPPLDCSHIDVNASVYKKDSKEYNISIANGGYDSGHNFYDGDDDNDNDDGDDDNDHIYDNLHDDISYLEEELKTYDSFTLRLLGY